MLTPASEASLPLAWQTLEAVPDPEIPVVSIRELGILRDVRVVTNASGSAAFEIVITPTYSGCPAMQQIAEDIDAAMTRAGLGPWHVTTVLAPPGRPTGSARGARKLRGYGIAPPTGTHAVAADAPRKITFYGRPKTA